MAVNDLGVVRPGSTILLPFHTFDSNDPSASVTLTGLALADIGIYKGTSMTERASTAGVVLLDTDGIDIDTTTGIHGLSIDLSDNTTAGFYTAGSRYYVTVASVTVDAATVNFVLATFTIGYEGAILNTTIATLASQTSFTLTLGAAEASAYVGCPVIVHDIASEVQIAIGYISAYAVTTKTVTLAADPGIFTMAAGDNVSIFMPSNVQTVAGTAQTAGDLAALVTTVDTVVDGIQTDLDNGTDGLGAIKAETALIVADTNELQSDDVPGLIATLDAVVDTVKVDTAAILVDTGTTLQAELDGIQADTEDIQTQIGTAGDGLTDLGGMSTAMKAEIESEVNDALDTAIAELGVAAPTATPTIRTALMLMYMALRNKTVVQTSGTDALEIYNNAGTKIASKLLTDDGADYTEAEMA